MNKTAIKNFAVWARNKLIADIRYRAGLIGITESGIASALPQSTGTTEFYDIGTAEPYVISGDEVRQRRRLVELIERKEKETDYKTAYKYIIEEVAYTWFNRLVAIRFMEVNDYLPSHIRVLSSESGKMEPDLVTTPFDADLEFTDEEQQLIYTMKQENQLDDLFRLLLIKQCNLLNQLLPELFEKTNDYTELLLNVSVIDKDGLIYHLVNDISESDFNIEQEGQIEIIGWMYQFYNIEPKAEVFSKSGKIVKDEIPAATQLFTPEWIVRYMVENSIGRLWLEGHPDDEIRNYWNYYLDECDQDISVQSAVDVLRKEYITLNPENIKVIDPCMGSGHILVRCFDLLMQIYESQGYTRRDAAQLILENNIFGLDVDKRAAQLAYFAVMMKARQYDRRIFTRDINVHVYSIEESNSINKEHIKYFGTSYSMDMKKKIQSDILQLISDFTDAKEYGSTLRIREYNWNLLNQFVIDLDMGGQISFETVGIENTQEHLLRLIEIGRVLSQKYDVVITNPPYMSVTAADAKLSSYIKNNYPDSKTDLFAVFMEKCNEMLAPNRFQAMITMHSWMFLSSFEKLRKKVSVMNIINMIHLGARAFEEIGGEVVQTTSFVLRKSHIKRYKGKYCRLIAPNTQNGKEKMFLDGENQFICDQESFSKISGAPITYWVSDQMLKAFDNQTLSKIASPKVGLQTGENDRFVRLWYEVSYDRINLSAQNRDEAKTSEKRWFPYNKGGDFRKWYGNNDYIVNWENDGYEIRHFTDLKGKLRSRPQNTDTYFRESITWSKISSGNIAFRYKPFGHIYDVAGTSVFADHDLLLYLQGFCNSSTAMKVANILSPTINYEVGHIASFPIIIDKTKMKEIIGLVEEAITLTKEDWDAFETSWDFENHPLANGKTISEAFELWDKKCKQRFDRLKAIEETINRIFIRIYGLQDELSYEVDDKYVSIRKADLNREIRSLLSYAIGCMFGRYSIDSNRLIYAGGNWNANEYYIFKPDNDNCIPITDEEYFADDIIGGLCKWLKVVYGKDSLEDNLDFIAKGLGIKGNTSREIIRNYFLNEFFKDHLKIYQKRPIYWLYDSGKNNGFKALVYMHRYNSDTIGNIRVDYLHRMQRVYESEINRMQDMIDHSTNAREVAAATKRKEKLQKQLKECREYDEKIGHLALSRIDIDLDDGVKVNYEKVQTASDGKKYQVLAKI